jgi:hypothetical protein
MTTKPPIQKILQRILHKANKTMTGQTKFPHQKTRIGKLDLKGRSNNLLPTGDPSHQHK